MYKLPLSLIELLRNFRFSYVGYAIQINMPSKIIIIGGSLLVVAGVVGKNTLKFKFKLAYLIYIRNKKNASIATPTDRSLAKLYGFPK